MIEAKLFTRRIVRKTVKGLLGIFILMLIVSPYALAEQVNFVVGETFEITSDKLSSEEVPEFFRGTPRMTELIVEDYYTHEAVTTLKRGEKYLFNIWFSPGICDDYYNELAVFLEGKNVFYTDWDGQNQGDCGISGTGIVVEIPQNAPTKQYSWGARSTNSQGQQDIIYPAHFTIQ